MSDRSRTNARENNESRAREDVPGSSGAVSGADGTTAGGSVAQASDRAVRAALTPRSAIEGDPTIVVAAPAEPLRLFETELGETGVLGGVVAGRRPGRDGASSETERAFDTLVDGVPVAIRLEWIDERRAVLVRGVGAEATRIHVLLGPVRRMPDGSEVREAVVGGWRFEVGVESERRAALRERSRRGGRAGAATGRLEIRAIIPGRIVAVSVAPGDPVTAGQQLLVLEAMKMQNELRAPREGTVSSVAVAVGTNVEVGDVLMVLE